MTINTDKLNETIRHVEWSRGDLWDWDAGCGRNEYRYIRNIEGTIYSSSFFAVNECVAHQVLVYFWSDQMDARYELIK